MYSLAARVAPSKRLVPQLLENVEIARTYLAEGTYPAAMFDFVKSKYNEGLPWEETRDAIYERYQVDQADGYDITSQDLYCNGCFAAGINFASSLVSFFYGEGDLKETIKIGALTGWDSDNPTATWGGMLGFIIGKKGVEKEFNRSFSKTFYIHRTRIGFENDSYDSFTNMALKGIRIADHVVINDLDARIDEKSDQWIIPAEKK